MLTFNKTITLLLISLEFICFSLSTDYYSKCKDDIYTVCFGSKENQQQNESYNCMTNRDCKALVYMSPDEASGKVRFDLTTWDVGHDSGGWMAVALSEDEEVGNDLISECLLLPNRDTIVRQAYDNGNGSE